MNRNAFFDQVADSDDPLLFRACDMEQIDGLHRRLGNMEGLRVVEPGCGVGPLTELLAQWVGPRGRVLSFDSSAGMVAQCRRRLAPWPQVEIQQAAIEAIEVAPGQWDRVILFRVFPHLDDKPGVLRRLRPWLAPGGRLVIANMEGSRRLNELHAGFSMPVRHDHMPCAHALSALLRQANYTVATALDTDREFYVEAAPVTDGAR